MAYEIEFLPVGDKSRAGDAIVIRYGEPTNFKLMLVDGGTRDTGEKIVEHVHRYFGKAARFDDVLLSHSDADHASGLRTVIDQIPTTKLWMHVPWLLARQAKDRFKDKHWTDDGIEAAVKSEYDILSDLVASAQKRGIAIEYPFQGAEVGPFIVLSPSWRAYRNLLAQFDKTPDPDQAAIEADGFWLGKEVRLGLLSKMSEAVRNWVGETWGLELLRDDGKTSASNESSTVLYAAFAPTARILLTGDAGVRGLTMAADYADARGLPLRQFRVVQIPHHGSRRNVGPTILTRLIGPRATEGTSGLLQAWVSAPADDAAHPRKMVLNAFIRRGAAVYATQGGHIHLSDGFLPRPNYSPKATLPFSPAVEAYDN